MFTIIKIYKDIIRIISWINQKILKVRNPV
jgi:hypothetical protein